MHAMSHDRIDFQGLIWGQDSICEVYNVKPWTRATGDFGLGSTAVMTFNNITNWITGDQYMRWGIPGMRNYIDSAMITANDSTIDFGYRNTFSHITVQSQVALEDGIWWDTHRVTDWYHIA